MTRVYLVRHAVHNLVGKTLAGRMPGVHLGPEGRAQALRLADYFSARDVIAVLTSPLERCRETAEPIAERLGLEAWSEEALNEIDCGDWTGRGFAGLGDDPQWIAWNTERQSAAIPGGETMAAVQNRAMGIIEHYGSQPSEPAMLVSHGDVIKAVVASLLGAPLQWHDRLQIDPASITTVDLWPGGGKIVRLNEVVSS